MLPIFTYGTETLGGDLENSHWKVSEEGHEDIYDVLCQSAFFDNLSYFVGECDKFPKELCALKLTMSFQQ